VIVLLRGLSESMKATGNHLGSSYFLSGSVATGRFSHFPSIIYTSG